MSLQWTEKYLRTTGDARDEAFADSIAGILEEREEDVPLPDQRFHDLAALVVESQTIVLASETDSLQQLTAEDIEKATANRYGLTLLTEPIIEPYTHLFDSKMIKPPFLIKNAWNTWNYKDIRSGLQLIYDFRVEYGRKKWLGPTNLEAVRMSVQTQQSDERTKLTFGYTDDGISSIDLTWDGHSNPKTILQLTGDSDLKNFITEFTLDKKVRLTSSESGSIKIETTGAQPMITIKQHIYGLGDLANEFRFNPVLNVFERFSSNPDLDKADNLSESTIMTVDEYAVILRDALALIPTRPL